MRAVSVWHCTTKIRQGLQQQRCCSLPASVLGSMCKRTSHGSKAEKMLMCK